MLEQSTTRQEWARKVHEALFSITVAFAMISVLFIALPEASIPFMHMEVSINRFLHIRQTDIIRGYFEFSIPSAVLAFFLWLLLRFASQTKFTTEFLRSAAGVLVLSALPLFWFYVAFRERGSSDFHHMLLLLELAIILIGAVLFLYRVQMYPLWCWIVLIGAHYAFWFYMRSNYQLANYAGPIAPIVGFCSGSAWAIYVNQMRRGSMPLARHS